MKQKVRSQFFILGKTHLKVVMMRMMAEMKMQQLRTRFQPLLQPQAHPEQQWWHRDKTRLDVSPVYTKVAYSGGSKILGC